MECFVRLANRIWVKERLMKLTNKIPVFAIFGILASAVPGTASQIAFESLPGNNTSFGNALDYQLNWNAIKAANPTPPVGYGNAAVTLWDWDGSAWPQPGHVLNQGLINGGSDVNIAFHYRVDFWLDASEAGDMALRIAPDFGFGGSVFLNGTAVRYNPNDMWWNSSWNDSNQLFEFSANLAPGHHNIDVYGQEGCCDGPTAAQFSLKQGSWVAFSSTDGLNSSSVPENLGVMAFAATLGALGLARVRLPRAFELQP